MRKAIRFALIGFVVFGLIFAGGTWAGFAISGALDQRSSLMSRALARVESYYNSTFRQDDPNVRIINTNRLQIREESVFLPLEAADFAGGISATGDGTEVLIMDRVGTLFHVVDSEVTQLAVSPPDNGIIPLQDQLESGDFGRATVDFKWFRYNDVLHVQGTETDWLLTSYTEWHPEDFCFNSALARLPLAPGTNPQDWQATAADWEVITRTAPCLEPFERGKAIKALEAGGRIVQRDADTVIWTSGAYERDDRHPGRDFTTALAQRDDSDYGKVLEVDIVSGEMRHIAKGLRNPQGVDIDTLGRIWVTDHGMRAGDELNLVRPGANFGWPAVSYGTHYDRRPAGNGPRHAGHEGYDLPAIAFVPGIAPGSAVALENFHYAWDGGIIVGAFRGFLHHVHVAEGRVAYVEPLEIEARPRDMVMLEDGRFAVWTDDRRLIYYSAAEEPNPVEAINAEIAALSSEDLKADVDATFQTCLACHGFARGEHGAGPSLAGLCGRSIAGTDFASYSSALSAIGGDWDTEKLTAFIANPEEFAPGTTMALGPTDPETAAALASALCTGTQ